MSLSILFKACDQISSFSTKDRKEIEIAKKNLNTTVLHCLSLTI